MRVKCFRSLITDPYLNLAIEDWIFRKKNQYDMILMLWRNDPCVVIGRNQNPWTECDLTRMRQLNVPLVRRQSGGGTVYHDLGNTNYSIMMPREKFNMKRNAEVVARAIRQLDIEAKVNDRNDIVVRDQIGNNWFKVSGSAYRVVSQRAFHHGTMLVNADLQRLRNCLRSNTVAGSESDDLVSKAVRSIPSPVLNLSQLSLTVDHLSVCQSIAREFLVEYAESFSATSFEDLNLNDGSDEDLVETLTSEKVENVNHIQRQVETLKSWDWMIGQTPDFTYRGRQVHRGLIDIENVSQTGTKMKFDEFLLLESSEK